MLEFRHKPVMVAEVLAALRPQPGGSYLDATVGGGGHAVAILEASQPTGWLLGIDRDPEAIAAASRRLAPMAGRFELRRGNFADLTDFVEPLGYDGVLMDLGVSTYQLETAGRGFSFQLDGPLDMRMDQQQGGTAAQWINRATVDEMTMVFQRYGDERQARRIARAIAGERLHRPLETTGQLAGLVARIIPRPGQRIHPATRVFQALRMVVNDEVNSLRRGLEAAWVAVKIGGRLVVLTFHSVEDRAVKDFARQRSRDYQVPGTVDIPELRQPCQPQLKWVHRKALFPSEREQRENPRARSAQLRVFERIYGAQS